MQSCRAKTCLKGIAVMSLKSLMLCGLMVATLAVTSACDSSASQQELTDARATASAAMSALEAANMSSSSTNAAGNTGMDTTDGNRLTAIKERGVVICASRNDVPGFGFLDASGRNIGFDIDLCRAVAAAVLGDAEAIEVEYINAAEMGPTLQSGQVDVLARTVTRSTSRDAQWGNFGPTMFYDGQGFMVPRSLGVTSAFELDGAAVCVTGGTTTELNLADFFRENGMTYAPTVFEDQDVVLDSYDSGQCDAVTNDHSGLAAFRSGLANSDDHVILPETISEEPLTPAVPHGDEQWYDVMNVVMAGLIHAEAYGVNSKNVDEILTTDNVKIKRLLGVEGSFGQETLGLNKTFMQDVIKSVGNYGEIYDRSLGPNGIGLVRDDSRNELWTNGGQIYAPPLR